MQKMDYFIDEEEIIKRNWKEKTLKDENNCNQIYH